MLALIVIFVIFDLMHGEAVSAAERSTVAVIASDMPHLTAPTSRDSVPTDQAIEAMVRKAMEWGGIRDVLRPDARHVLLKPCIVVAKRDPERNTDPRVVRAVALVVHEIAPRARITVGEGPGAWMKEVRPEVKHWELVIADGFETEGYYAALDDPRLADARIEFVDLNFAETRLVKVPGGGWARDEYWLPVLVLDADVTITIPRLKTHMADLGGITVAMKNQVGVAPGMKYGWPKKTGYPSGSGNPGLPHSNEVLGEMITDLNLCAGIDFAVAESFRRDFDETRRGKPSWVNAVVAGADLVAVDAVSAYLMGKLENSVFTLGLGQSSGGMLLADAYREHADADLGVALAWEVGEPVPAGAVTRGDLLDLIHSEDARLASWTVTGAQVDSLLEGLIEQAMGEPRDTPQLSGFTATVDLSRPRGDRVHHLSLEPGQTYRLATLDWYAGWFHRMLTGEEEEGEGEEKLWPDQVEYPLTPVQAVEAFLNRHRPYAPVEESSLIVTHVETR